MHITIVGCAGSYPAADSSASCYLVDTGSFRLVIDLGNGALGSLQRYLGLEEVDAVCLSHLHADHCVDMCSFAVTKRHHPRGRGRRIPVYAPAGAHEHLSRALSPDPDPTGMLESFAFIDLDAGATEIGPLRIITARMNHPVETFGFRIEHDGEVLAYSADTGPEPELLRLAAGADVLLCEASFVDGPGLPPDLHLTARQAGEYAAQAGVGELVLTHLVAWNDPAATQEQAAQTFEGRLSLARPGKRILGDADTGVPPR